jgi:hypothetical protein
MPAPYPDQVPHFEAFSLYLQVFGLDFSEWTRPISQEITRRLAVGDFRGGRRCVCRLCERDANVLQTMPNVMRLIESWRRP